MNAFRTAIWFIVLNLAANEIWTNEVSYWFVIELVIVLISLLMVYNPKE